MAQSALLAAFIAGLLGGLHCAAMCGGWMAAAAAPPAGGAIPLLPRRALWLRLALHHAGRIATYALLGAALGAGGGAAIAQSMAPLQRALYVVANVALILVAVSIARRRATAPAMVERAGLGVFRRVAPALTRFAQGRRVAGPLAMGALWGLTPCALVYGLLPVALLSGSAANGAAVMAIFGLGTLPNLLAAQALIARTRGAVGATPWRLAAAILVGAFGVLGIARALFVPDALGTGAYCLVPPAAHGTLAGVSHP